ncbi:GNAT family N-acetyltransferase [Paenarthrobacter sp. PH39-S1]|uniref:GNAT family N-acetyltransferase n=1 Tax=Paenarthrobacter sp. PH39-S1 TaxID=3046204 RepID=UPI0024B95CED|nr:GNAT family N-acetyltransferase [Paenarthrobacter sp. PH39-S1]MDJ0355951.1 GNAT family N-acetyltransferase [Paenarthrobacter sp. PH39-S1]
MKTEKLVIRPTTEADWLKIRDLRLKMINDTPIACAETEADALAHDETEWRRRGAQGSRESSITVAAIDEYGNWVGTMGSYIAEPSVGPLLVGVYVSPEFRGTDVGVTDTLLSAVEEWASNNGGRLTLHVHEDNVKAQRAYSKRGFEFTGHSVEYSLDPSSREVEMTKELIPAAA